MDLHELRVAARLIDGLAKRALFAEKQMVALEGQCAEWQRIADDLKAERNELRSTTIDTATVDALTAELRKEREAHAETAESLAFRLETERLQMGKDVERLTKERDGLLTQVQDMRAEIERLKKPARQHPVAVGEWVECILTDACDQRHPLYRIGSKGRVGRIVERPNYIFEYHVTIGSDQVWWESSYCIPCDPPEATHDTPEGKQVAESVIRDCRNTEPDDEFKVGDVVEVISSLGPHTYTTDIGARGIVEEISKGGEYIDLEPVNGFRAAYGCRVSLRDVRKVTPVVKSCIEIVEDAK